MIAFMFRNLMALALVLAVLPFTGCQEELAHQKSVAKLNQSAAALIQQGNYAGAVARLESARDLVPNSAPVLYNLSMAYQQAGQVEQSVAGLEQFTHQFGSDERFWPAKQSLAVLYQQLGAQTMPTPDDDTSEDTAAATPQPPKNEAKAKEYYAKALTILKELHARAKDDGQQQLIADNIEHVEGVLTGQPRNLVGGQ